MIFVLKIIESAENDRKSVNRSAIKRHNFLANGIAAISQGQPELKLALNEDLAIGRASTGAYGSHLERPKFGRTLS